MSKITILGIDPASIRNLGLAVISLEDSKLSLIEHFTSVFPDFRTDGERLSYAYGQIQQIIDKFSPDVVSIELSMGFGKAFVRKNLQETVGIIKLCCHNNEIEIKEIAPKHIKLIIAGSGNAKKNDIKEWVKNIVNIQKQKTEHEADATAVALTYLIDKKLIDKIH
jgi:crossover junction endodeoxyribonuclease RuvC